MNIEELIGLFLENEEFKLGLEIIADSDIAYNIAMILKDDFNKRFYGRHGENLDCKFEELLDNNDILSIEVVYEYGKPIYYLQEIIDDDETLISEADISYVQDDLLDIIDTSSLNGQVLTFYYEDLDSEYEHELDELIDQALEDIEELQEENPDFCIHCYLKENLASKFYLLGYNNGLKMLREGINEILGTK
ncbi:MULTISPECIES: hypothetical protein [unclassified Clostridium]|uniref:hypothetical protein n=1 Tax=unclassified Clostridium TaxID=2614128 RepID=UPI0020796A9B|nr:MULTISPECIES: hypothetical protein [unclassified Clostridium]